jgi:teichuronic acid biosynthesis glycosyltransferase TuaC
MRVAVITRYFPTSFHPWAGHSAYQTLRFLAQHGEVKVFYPESQYPAILTPRSRTHPALDQSYEPGGVPVEYIPYPAVPVLTRPLNGWTAARRLLPKVREFRPDVILNYVVYPDGFAAVQIGAALNVPVVLTAIGTDLNVIPDPLCGMLTRRTLHEADFLVTVSGALRKTALSMGAWAERSKAILNGCDTSVFYPQDLSKARRKLGIEEEGEAVVYVGRLDLAKGLRELVEAATIAKAKHPQMRCYLVGDGADRPGLVAQVAKQGAEDWIKFVDPCPTDQVATWMAAADLVTLPSYREGCPNVVLEALAAGRPMVATNIGGIPELMDESCGLMVPAKDTTRLAKALSEVLARDWNASEISSRHSRSWSNVSDDVQKVLENVIAARN